MDELLIMTLEELYKVYDTYELTEADQDRIKARLDKLRKQFWTTSKSRQATPEFLNRTYNL